ncbi:10813_t:CDS:2 [Diversispora eburnea]|uniref:10813_t:CDS:1 n=1 Tax=Diversispora eburnea TaxID=1213867 RepID=A0A9N9G888_9GLOM|nr:10813_t:CDS:2 [Diversispora eburnea]
MSTPMEIDLPAGSKASGKAKDTGKKRFEVKKWNAVALWAWAFDFSVM